MLTDEGRQKVLTPNICITKCKEVFSKLSVGVNRFFGQNIKTESNKFDLVKCVS